jgi:hypothetical protein
MAPKLAKKVTIRRRGDATRYGYEHREAFELLFVRLSYNSLLYRFTALLKLDGANLSLIRCITRNF